MRDDVNRADQVLRLRVGSVQFCELLVAIGQQVHGDGEDEEEKHDDGAQQLKRRDPAKSRHVSSTQWPRTLHVRLVSVRVVGHGVA